MLGSSTSLAAVVSLQQKQQQLAQQATPQCLDGR
jgi:hypothetical protein